jgi:hypothetical protein
MVPKWQLSVGQICGRLVLRRRLPYAKKAPVNLRKVWVVECNCGTSEAFEVPEYYLLRKGNPKVDCGCSRKTIKTLNNEEFRIWLMMHVRTEDPRHHSYKDYGGRGIRVCPEWNRANPDGKGFDRFLEFVGKRPSSGHTIDRVNNDLGYQPYDDKGNVQVRWATATEQRANQRPRKETSQ